MRAGWGYVKKVCSTGLSDKWDLGREDKRGISDDSVGSGLRKQGNTTTQGG